MSVTRVEIGRWFDQAVRDGATHMMVVLDGYNFDEFPVNVMYGEDPQERADEYNTRTMQRVLEVYDLSISKEVQLNMVCAWNTGPAPTRSEQGRV